MTKNASLPTLFQTADWKLEKHVPVIEVLEKKGDGTVTMKLSVGKGVPHPNTTEHHIAWIEAYFLPEGETFPYQLGRFEFNAHGASAQGPNMSTIYTQPEATFAFKTGKNGTVFASSYCNVHGLWTSSTDLKN